MRRAGHADSAQAQELCLSATNACSRRTLVLAMDPPGQGLTMIAQMSDGWRAAIPVSPIRPSRRLGQAAPQNARYPRAILNSARDGGDRRIATQSKAAGTDRPAEMPARVPDRTIAQLRSPTCGDTHQAAVRLPFAEPSKRHFIAGAATSTCPVEATLREPPSSFASCSRAARPLASGHGCPGLQVSSISRAAIPSSRMRGPSVHQIGPSPSQTRVGVQVKAVPAATMGTRSRKSTCRPLLATGRIAIPIQIPPVARSPLRTGPATNHRAVEPFPSAQDPKKKRSTGCGCYLRMRPKGSNCLASICAARPSPARSGTRIAIALRCITLSSSDGVVP